MGRIVHGAIYWANRPAFERNVHGVKRKWAKRPVAEKSMLASLSAEFFINLINLMYLDMRYMSTPLQT